MDVSIEDAYAESCRLLGHQLVVTALGERHTAALQTQVESLGRMLADRSTPEEAGVG